jgi:ABC-type branched-subunit amino acid transport system permease subunit
VKGEKFTRNAPLTLALVGVAGQLSLATVRADSTGTFTAAVLIPTEAPAGSYRLVATAEDGDEVASLDVTVSAAATADHANMPGHDATDMDPPSNEPLALERAGRRLVTWSVVAGIGLAVVGGLVLLRRPANGP